MSESHFSVTSRSPASSFATTSSRVHARPVRSANAARWSGQKHPGFFQMRRVSSSTMKKSGFAAESVRHVRAM